jgi:hypothetical protein
MFPTWSDWDIRYTRRGLWKNRALRALRYLVLTAAITGLYRARYKGINVAKLLAIYKGYARIALLTGAGLLQKASAKV